MSFEFPKKLKEKIADMGKRAVGLKKAVEFKRSVDDMSKRHGSPRDRVEFAMFGMVLDTCARSLRSGNLDPKSLEMTQMFGAIREVLGRNGVRSAREKSGDPAAMRRFGATPVPAAMVENFYRGRNQGQRVNPMIAHDLGLEWGKAQALMQRVVLEMGNTPRANQKIAALPPQELADLGALVTSMERIERHNSQIERDARTVQAAKDIKEDGWKWAGRTVLYATDYFLYGPGWRMLYKFLNPTSTEWENTGTLDKKAKQKYAKRGRVNAAFTQLFHEFRMLGERFSKYTGPLIWNLTKVAGAGLLNVAHRSRQSLKYKI